MLGKCTVRHDFFPLGFDVVLTNLTFVDYIPKDSTDGGGTNTKQVSRTLEV